jgi:hypothetical protein
MGHIGSIGAQQYTVQTVTVGLQRAAGLRGCVPLVSQNLRDHHPRHNLPDSGDVMWDWSRVTREIEALATFVGGGCADSSAVNHT